MAFGNTVKDGSGTNYWLLVDSNGFLKVVSQTGGDVVVDDAAFTPGTGQVGIIGAFADETAPDSVDEGDAGAVRMSLDRMLLVQVSGRAVEDAAAAGNPVLAGGRYDATPRTLDDGDAGADAIDAAGRAIVAGAAAEDAAVAGSPVLAGGRYDSAARTLDNGDVGAAAIDAAGRLIVAGAAVEDAAVAGDPVLVGGRYDSTARGLDNGDVGAAALNALGRLLVDTGWTPSVQADEALNDSDKKFTVPANTEWRIQSIWVEFISTATGGNRQLVVEIQDGSDDVVFRVITGLVQADTITRYYQFAPHLVHLTAFIDSDYLMTPFPAMVLPATYDIRIYDNNAVDAAADDMVVQMMIEARTV